MVTYLLYVFAALYLGVLTSISPCPLATNIAAISYIGRKLENPRLVINAGLLYTLGRCVLYLGLAALLTTTALSIPAVSLFLQKYMHLALGPIFLLLGMFLVGLDIVGDKLMEINVFSPGGLGSAQKFTKINFTKFVIAALERKMNYMKFYGRNFDNVDMCTL